MPRMTLAEYHAHEARIAAASQTCKSSESDCTDESGLHHEIIQHCKQKMWIVFHGSMAHKSKRTIGEPDFTILAPNKVLFIECKTRTGKLSPEQAGISAWAEKLGHTIYVVRSFKEFLSVLKDIGL